MLQEFFVLVTLFAARKINIISFSKHAALAVVMASDITNITGKYKINFPANTCTKHNDFACATWKKFHISLYHHNWVYCQIPEILVMVLHKLQIWCLEKCAHITHSFWWYYWVEKKVSTYPLSKYSNWLFLNLWWTVGYWNNSMTNYFNDHIYALQCLPYLNDKSNILTFSISRHSRVSSVRFWRLMISVGSGVQEYPTPVYQWYHPNSGSPSSGSLFHLRARPLTGSSLSTTNQEQD